MNEQENRARIIDSTFSFDPSFVRKVSSEADIITEGNKLVVERD